MTTQGSGYHYQQGRFTSFLTRQGAPDSDGYSTASEATNHWHHHRGCRGSREKKQLALARLDMPIFKSTDPGAEVMYTLWHFDVDAFLEQYDEASMHPHIFASLHGYPGKWAHTLDEGKDISMQDLLMHMEKMFGNKWGYDAMIRMLYEVQQKENKTVEEYMLHIHNAVMVICHMYPEHLHDHGRDLKKDRFYHGLHPYLHDALSFAMVELPKREQACSREAQMLPCTPTGRLVALEEEGVVSANPTSRGDSDSEVEAVDGLNMH